MNNEWTPERIAADRALCDAATVGPWGKHGSTVVNPAGDAELGNWFICGPRWMPDRDFIIAARTELPATLDEIERQAKEIDRLSNIVKLSSCYRCGEAGMVLAGGMCGLCADDL
jgi:hypothetical protein